MKNLIALASLLISASALASPAVTYDCVGTNSASAQEYDRPSVVFQLTFSDSDIKEGYTNQSIDVSAIGGVATKMPTLQMYGATKKNSCKKNSAGEVYLNSADFSMEPAPDKLPAAYIVKFSSACDAKNKLVVAAYCVTEY